MVNIKMLTLSCIFLLSVFAVIPVAADAGNTVSPTVTPQVTARATQASYVIASAHNYANSYTYTWPAKTVTGATQIRVHFTRLEVEATYDKVYILNSAGTTIQTFGLTAATSTYSTGVWSSWVTGTTFKVKLTTDSSVTKWGFATDLIEYNTATGDTTAPTVSISAPTAGATVSGTTTISATASDNVGVTSVGFYVDSTLKSTDTASPYSYAWDTTAYTNGAHSIYAIAYDAAGNSKTSTSVSVTVSNTVTIPTLTSGVAKSGSISASGGSVMYQITVPSGCTSMLTVVSDPTSADFDSYGKQGSQPTTSSYTWRGYTSNHPESVTYANPAAGVWYIMVKSYSGTGSFTITCTLSTGGGGGGGAWGTGGKYAVIVGISNYASINDLSFCDEDALDWYNFLVGKGYECHVFYDGSYTSNSFTSIPTSSGAGSSGKVAQATEANVRAAIQGLAAQAVSGNQVAFVTSGHGSGDGAGSSYLCMYDCSGSTGCYYDTELKADFNLFVSGVKIFVFVDHCYSGGLGPEMMTITAKATLYMTTTCTANGYGYDDSAHSNGAWTYYFLENYLVGHSTASMESVFSAVSPGYPYTGGDAPMQFDGNTASAFYV
jgi:YD repeat-containing protein